MAAVKTPWYVLRVTYLVMLSLFFTAILLQAYFAGRYIWGIDDDNGLHAGLGWPLAHTFALLVAVVGLLARGGKRVWITNLVWLAVAIVLPVVAVLDETGPAAAEALHPFLAMVLLLLTSYLGLRTAALVREGRVQVPAPQVQPLRPGAPRIRPRPPTT